MATRSNDSLLTCLHHLHEKVNQLTLRLSDPDIVSQQDTYRELSRELSIIKPVDDLYLQLKDRLKQKEEAEEISDTDDDPEFAELAKLEIESLSADIIRIDAEIRHLLVTDQATDHRNAYLEIRAGAGGNEASLFATDLLRMYHRVAERRGWKAEVISTAYSTIGGIKEVILHIRGKEVFRNLKFESGVHRVQRVPVTESSGRIHTSTVTVAVLPEVKDVEISINPKDIRIDTYRASGCGGQHVNKTESAIRITHFPSGVVVTCQDESSQHKNRDKAMSVLKSRLYEHERSKRENDIASDRRSQVGSGDRSEKIRTYNFPQSRATDHRVSGRNFNLETILDGNFNELIEGLSAMHQEKALEDRCRELTAPCDT